MELIFISGFLVKLWIAENILGMWWGVQGPNRANTRSLNRRGIGPFLTNPGLPVLALQLSLMIYFRSIPAGGDKRLWVICVLNITSRIHRECYLSWVIDWWLLRLARHNRYIDLSKTTYTCIVSNPFLRLWWYYLFPLQSAIQLKLLTWQKIEASIEAF